MNNLEKHIHLIPKGEPNTEAEKTLKNIDAMLDRGASVGKDDTLEDDKYVHHIKTLNLNTEQMSADAEDMITKLNDHLAKLVMQAETLEQGLYQADTELYGVEQSISFFEDAQQRMIMERTARTVPQNDAEWERLEKVYSMMAHNETELKTYQEHLVKLKHEIEKIEETLNTTISKITKIHELFDENNAPSN